MSTTEPEQAAATGDGEPSKFYTRTGDTGETALEDRSRTKKSDIRIAARGECEEACAVLGMAITLAYGLSDEIALLLTRIENDLVDVGADIGVPLDGTETDDTVRIDEGYVRRLERACEHFGSEITGPLSVILPGGTTVAATLHHAYTVVRRAERSAYLALQNQEKLNPVACKYLNRLGSLLFVLARTANLEQGDIVWHPGMTRELGDAGLWEPIPEPEE